MKGPCWIVDSERILLKLPRKLVDSLTPLVPLLAIYHNSSQEACPRHSLLLCSGKNLRKNVNSFQKMSTTRCTTENDKQWRRKMVPKIQITTVSTALAPGCWLPWTRGITHNQSKFGENIYSAKSLASGHAILAKTDHTPGTWAVLPRIIVLKRIE